MKSALNELINNFFILFFLPHKFKLTIEISQFFHINFCLSENHFFSCQSQQNPSQNVISIFVLFKIQFTQIMVNFATQPNIKK